MSNDLDIYSIIIDSRSRLSGDPSNFKVRFNPTLNRAKKLTLQSTFLPFNFNNVTSIYGNTLHFTLNTSGPFFDGTLTVPVGFYTISQLLVVINQLFTDFFQANGGYTSPIVLTFSQIPNRIIINYNTSVLDGATLTFIPPAFIPSLGFARNYLYLMLGLSGTTNTVFNFPTSATVYVDYFANPTTIQLPISYVLIFIEGLPAKVLSSTQIAANFYIDIFSANLNGSEIALPNNFKAMRDYYDTVEISDNFFNFAELSISITDNFGQLLTEQNVIDWHFSFTVTSYR